MSQYLPTSDFTWLPEREIKSLDIFSIFYTSSKEYVLDADLEYPKSLHDTLQQNKHKIYKSDTKFKQ